jgi:NAD(P)-dependent dehydrogenase (short-subunit alcohol dehydrogenase family)
MLFSGKTAIITGASQGIGFAVAEALVSAGANVVLTARRRALVEEAVEKLGPTASCVVGDVADPDTAERATARAVEAHGGLDLLVCNAGVLLPGALTQQPLTEVDQVLTVNLRGTIVSLKAAIPALAAAQDAAVVVITSSIGRQPAPGLGVYGATKAALHYLIPTWASELAQAGVRVNGVCAGITKTPGLDAVAQDMIGLEEMVIGTNLIKRIGVAEEIARPVLTLLDSSTSGYVTGSIWDVDGGYQLDHGQSGRNGGDSDGAAA